MIPSNEKLNNKAAITSNPVKRLIIACINIVLISKKTRRATGGKAEVIGRHSIAATINRIASSASAAHASGAGCPAISSNGIGFISSPSLSLQERFPPAWPARTQLSPRYPYVFHSEFSKR